MNHNSNSFQTTRQKHWTARENRRLNGWRWEIIDFYHDTVAVVYSGRGDAELLASAPQQHAAAQELRACSKQLLAMLARFEEQLMPWELEELNRARELASH